MVCRRGVSEDVVWAVKDDFRFNTDFIFFKYQTFNHENDVFLVGVVERPERLVFKENKTRFKCEKSVAALNSEQR